MWIIDLFGKMKPNLELTIVWLLVSPKNVILCVTIGRVCESKFMCDLLAFIVSHIYSWFSPTDWFTFLKKIDMHEHVSCLCFLLNQCDVKLYRASECVVKSVNVVSRSNFNMHAYHYVLSIMKTMYHTCVIDFGCTN